MNTSDREKYPELAKMEDARPSSQVIGEFLDWLSDKGLTICAFHPTVRNGIYHPTHKSIEQTLADYFEIDLNKIENERRQILDEFRAAQEKAS